MPFQRRDTLARGRVPHLDRTILDVAAASWSPRHGPLHVAVYDLYLVDARAGTHGLIGWLPHHHRSPGKLTFKITLAIGAMCAQ